MEVELPIFGKIKLQEINWKNFDYKFEAWKWKYNFEGVPIDLNVHFKNEDKERISIVASILNDLKKIHTICKNAILKDFEEGVVVQEYIEEWNEDIFLQMFEENEFQKFIEKTDKNKSIEERLLSLIRIVRIGIYVKPKEPSIIVDFAFGYDDALGFREDMVVVKLNFNFEVVDICTEG